MCFAVGHIVIGIHWNLTERFLWFMNEHIFYVCWSRQWFYVICFIPNEKYESNDVLMISALSFLHWHCRIYILLQLLFCAVLEVFYLPSLSLIRSFMHRQNKPSAQLPQPNSLTNGEVRGVWDWTPISPGELIRQSPYCPGQGHSQQEILSAHCSR